MPISLFARVEPVLLAALFAVAHTQAPFAFSNQNQYLLHGLAAAGYGHLSHDWLANTRDPTPLFSGLVAAGHAVAGLASVQAVYFVLVMGYFLAARWLVGAIPRAADALSNRLAFAALFTAAHAALPRVVSVWLTGTDYPWFVQAGLAGQYLLGPGLQPSAFGVLLLAAVAAFAHRRPVAAGLLTAAAGAMHATYLLPGALFVLGMLVSLALERKWRTAAVVAGVALLAVLPTVGYVGWAFAPSEAAAETRRILAEVRIPHHCVVSRWLDWVAWAQMAWVAFGIGLARRTPLFPVLLVMAFGAAALTVLQVNTGSHAIALLFPWRVSTVLVPVATAVVFARLVALLPASQLLGWVSGVALAVLVAGGVWVTVARIGYAAPADERGVLTWVREHAGPKDVYLLPVSVPKPTTKKGVTSASFLPPPRPAEGTSHIPVDLQRFRLLTGAAAFVDFKSVPYADAEVLEWDRRVKQAAAWFKRDTWGPDVLNELRKVGVTHVVVPKGRGPTLDAAKEYEDDAYTVYRVG